ncbi:methyltransferase ubiE [Beggiatoa sp. PS]|nr:methyltransferase ubiE [Beggiatoa sp. PS]
MQDTLTLLAQHHRDGPEFMQLMKETAPNRFGDAFWATWEQWIVPVLSEQPQIADFGCGPGMLLALLRERYPVAHLIGVECAPWMLEGLVERQLYEVIEHDLHDPNLPIADNSLDAITNIVCIHEMSQPIRLLQSIHRCLKPGGRCLITDWVRVPLEHYIAKEVTEDIFDCHTHHERLNDIFTHFTEHNRYSHDDVIWMLQQVGFVIRENLPLKEGHFGQWVVEAQS